MLLATAAADESLSILHSLYIIRTRSLKVVSQCDRW